MGITRSALGTTIRKIVLGTAFACAVAAGCDDDNDFAGVATTGTAGTTTNRCQTTPTGTGGVIATGTAGTGGTTGAGGIGGGAATGTGGAGGGFVPVNACGGTNAAGGTTGTGTGGTGGTGTSTGSGGTGTGTPGPVY